MGERTTYDPGRVAQAVRWHRTDAQFTQAELAERAGLAFETISRVESGREPPSLRTAISLADALGISLDAVVGRGNAAPATAPRPHRPLLRRLAEAAEQADDGLLRHVLAILRALRPTSSPAPVKPKKARRVRPPQGSRRPAR